MIESRSHRLSATTPRLAMWVVVALIVIGAWMTWRWVAFHRVADFTQDVGGAVELADNTFAIAMLLSVPSELGVDAAGPIYLRLGSDGAITRIGRALFDTAVGQAPMPHGWAWPGAVGVVYVQEGNHAVTKVIQRTSTGLRVAAPRAEEIIDQPFPAAATMGFRCYDGCGDVFPYPIEYRATIDGAVVFQVPIGGRVEALIVFESATTEPEVINFLKELVRWHQPVKATRTLSNGRRITERVPMAIVAIPVTIDGAQTLIGNDTYSWTSIMANGAIVASTNVDLMREYVAVTSIRDRKNVPSTLVLTKNVCGQRPSAFFKQDFSQVFANLSLIVVREARSWSVCSDFR